MNVSPTYDAKQRFLALESGGPVVMLNLLRFTSNGRELYSRYAESVTPLIKQRGGHVVYAGDVATALVDGGHESWDALVLVSYPGAAALIQMLQSPEYQAIAHLRRDALESTLLAPTIPWRQGE
jgi:uncharacterized protein (DUF1330 family)